MPTDVTLIIRQKDISLIETDNGLVRLELLGPDSTKMFHDRDGRLGISFPFGSRFFNLQQIIKVEDRVRGKTFDAGTIPEWLSSLPEG